MIKSNILEFSLTKLNYNKFYSNSQFNFEELREILRKDFNSEIVSFIQQYYNPSDRGVINDFNLGHEYTAISQTCDEIQIECYFIFDVQYYFGCKDIDTTDEDQEMKVQIKLHINNCSIEIIGDKIYERDPDEY